MNIAELKPFAATDFTSAPAALEPLSLGPGAHAVISKRDLPWIEHIALSADAVRDTVLRRPLGPGRRLPNQTAIRRLHRPQGPIDPAFSGESSSYSFHVAIPTRKGWEALRSRLDAPSTDFHSEVEGIKMETRANVDAAIDRLAQVVGPHMPDRIRASHIPMQDRIIAASSGADAISAAKDLMLGIQAISATTRENGTKVLHRLQGKQDTAVLDSAAQQPPIGNETSLIVFDPRTSTNEPISDEDFLGHYETSIAMGARFISATAAVKSGRRYDAQIQSLAQKVAEHNEQTPDDPVVLVVDAMQLFGREEPQDTFKWLEVPGVAGVVTSGSKAALGISHAGFLYLSDEGMTRLDNNLDRTDADTIMEAIDRNQIVGRDFEVDGTTLNGDNYVMASFRVIDNVQAIWGLMEAPATLYDPSIHRTRELYTSVFADAGMRVFDDEYREGRQLPSILTMEPPADFSVDATHDLLTRLAAGDNSSLPPVSFGGILQETGHEVPLVRFAVNWLAVNTHTPEALATKLTDLQTVLGQNISTVRAGQR